MTQFAKGILGLHWILLPLLLVACSSEENDPIPNDGDLDSQESELDDIEGDTDPDETPIPARLRADGTALVDANGETVHLRGVNLGGWLFHETWITAVDYSLQSRALIVGDLIGKKEEIRDILLEIGPMKRNGWTPVMTAEEWLQALFAQITEHLGATTADAFRSELDKYLPILYDDSDLPLRKKLEDRFGPTGRDDLLDLFQQAWIKEEDIAWLAEQGFNLVRVPISYRTLVTNSDREPLTALNWNPRAFARIDDLLSWCETHQVYAILDIQECPGGQNDYSGPSTLYQDETMQALTVQLWEHLSDLYRSRDIVAAYSLLAEPMSAPSASARDAMYDKLVQAIRARGDDHLLVIHDGFLGMNSFPSPLEMGWSNVLYSTHLFEWDADSLEDYDFLIDRLYDPSFSKAESTYGVPVYIGSFSVMKDTEWAYQAADKMVKWMNRHGWPWTLWTYKRIDDPISLELWGDSSSWGLRGRLTGPFDRPDVYRDDRDTLERKFNAYADLAMAPNEALRSVLTQAEER